MAFPGSLVNLLGVALLYGAYAKLDLALLGARVTLTSTTWTGLSMITAGLVLKAALFPLHAWLPPVYASARPVVSAMLSALAGKTAFLVLLRLWQDVFPDAFAAVMGLLLGGLGAGAILWGSLVALRHVPAEAGDRVFERGADRIHVHVVRAGHSGRVARWRVRRDLACGGRSGAVGMIRGKSLKEP